MKISLLNAKQVGVQLERLMNESTNFYWAVAWATEMALASKLIGYRKKISRLVIGTDFAQSSPSVLRKLKPVKGARVMISEGGITFHPKVYCFESRGKFSAIVGSANFTRGGTHRNDESALLLEGTADEQPLQELLNSVSAWWDKGDEITDEFLVAYELRWQANQNHRKAIEKPLKIYRPTDKSTHPKLLRTPWPDFLREIRNSANHSLDGRLEILTSARSMFDRAASFDSLSLFERKAIAGILGKNEAQNVNIGNLEWGWFGSMKGAGIFKNRISENDAHLSAALEHIPLTGEVAEIHYAEFAREFRLAFKNSQKVGGVPTASRLLAMKRPDYFVCVDSKNARRLGADVGFAPSTLDLDNYWDRVVAPITEARWWNTERPVGPSGKVWDVRAAMLDAIYYEPD